MSQNWFLKISKQNYILNSATIHYRSLPLSTDVNLVTDPEPLIPSWKKLDQDPEHNFLIVI